MKPSVAASIALVLVPLGWVLAYVGAMSQFGDFLPNTAQSQIEAAHHQSMMILAMGVLCLLFSIWLSGFSFPVANKRAILAMAACILPVVAILGELL